MQGNEWPKVRNPNESTWLVKINGASLSSFLVYNSVPCSEWFSFQCRSSKLKESCCVLVLSPCHLQRCNETISDIITFDSLTQIWNVADNICTVVYQITAFTYCLNTQLCLCFEFLIYCYLMHHLLSHNGFPMDGACMGAQLPWPISWTPNEFPGHVLKCNAGSQGHWQRWSCWSGTDIWTYQPEPGIGLFVFLNTMALTGIGYF